MSGAHTPGPWSVNPFCAQVDCAASDHDGAPLPIAKLLWPTDYRSEAETEANARLIAAAPELLEALNKCRAIIKFHCEPEKCCSFAPDSEPFSAFDAFKLAMSAIAKATGQ